MQTIYLRNSMNCLHATTERLSRSDIEMINAIARYKSVTLAASDLRLSQSAVSHRLGNLERRLNAILFERAGRRMIPTGAGEVLAKHAQDVLERFAHAEAAAFTVANRSLIRIGTECFTSYHWLPGALRAWRASNLNLSVQIIMEATQRPIPALLQGEADVVLMYSNGIHAQMAATPLFRDELVLVVQPDHRLASSTFVELKELARERLILHSTAEGRNRFLDITLAGKGITPRAIWRVQLTDVILELVQAGEGISVLARWLVEPHLQRHSLKMVRLTKRGIHRMWRLVARRGSRHAKALPEYAQQLLESLKKNQTINLKKL